MQPLALTDLQLRDVSDICRVLPPWRRGEFLEQLAARLRGQEIGDGNVHRTAALVMRDVLNRPRRIPERDDGIEWA
jgi:hypothetical protein